MQTLNLVVTRRDKTCSMGREHSLGSPADFKIRLTSSAKLVSIMLRTVAFFTALPFVVSGQDTAGDIAALVALYNNTGGDHWYDNEGWPPTATISGLHGVTSAGGRVTKLDLSGNNLVGTLSAELGNLSALDSLSLDFNELRGPIPSQLGTISALTYLNLNFNQLSGPIPTQLGNLSALETLELSSNQLSGPIPTQLGNLSALEALVLDGNQLSGSIPSQLGALSALTDLNLSFNELSGPIPTQLGGLIALIILNLSDNLLTGSIPVTLGSLSQLVSLDLDGNDLSGAIPSELGRLSELSDFFVLGNNLSSIGDLTALSGTIDFFQVSYNYFEFDDLELNKDIIALNDGQKRLGRGELIDGDSGNPITLSFNIGGTNNSYEWTKDGNPISAETAGINGEDTSSLTISSYNATDHDGVYTLKITNTVVAGLTLLSKPKVVGPGTPVPMFGGATGEIEEVEACDHTFQDGGGSGNYMDEREITMTLVPRNDQERVRVIFTSFATSAHEDGQDILTVYDGKSIGEASLLGAYSGSSLPPDLTSTSPDGALTFHFVSDDSIAFMGWEATVECLSGPAIELSSREVFSGLDDEEVGTLSVHSAGDVTYTLAFGTNGDAGGKFKIEGDKLKTNRALTEGMETISLEAMALGETTLSREFEIAVVSPPAVTFGSPSPTAVAATVPATPSVAGNIHYVVLGSAQAAPVSLAEVMGNANAGSAAVGTAGAPQDITVTGLTASTDYALYAILSASDNTQLVGATVAMVAFRTTDPPAAIPSITFGSPSPTAVAVTVPATPSVAGNIHYVVLESTRTAPVSLAVVMRSANADSAAVETAGTPQDITVTGLTASTDYALYAILSASDNTQLVGATVARVAFRTADPATIIPSITFGSPSPTAVAATVPATPSVAGNIHYVVLESAQAAPVSLAAVMGSANAGSAAVGTAGTPQDITVTGLTASTDYALYAILSASDNTQLVGATVTRVAFRTADPAAIIPSITFGSPSPTAVAATVPATPSVAGNIHYVVLGSAQAAPVSLAAVMGNANAGSDAVETAGTPQDITVTGLTASTDYALFAILSASDNTQLVGATVVMVGFRTLSLFGADGGDIEVSIYPNPVEDVLHLDLPVKDHYEVAILTLTGQLILHERSVGGGSSTLELSNLSRGVYIVKIENSKGKSKVLHIIL